MSAEVRETLARGAALVEQRLRETVPRVAGDLLHEAAWHHLDSGGKRLRPALCLAACEALGGNPAQALDFAVAVELLHNMLLVHDDLEDRDRVRRDRPTVWARYGEANAVNVGDWLLGLAWRAVLRSPVEPALLVELATAFGHAFEKTVEGQSLDLNSRADPAFTVARYVEIATLKTGCYLALGLVGGAIVARAEGAVIEALWEFGRYAGPAFQVRDDLLDLTAGKGRGGRIGCDIEEGKPSILYAHALAQAAPAERERLVAVMAAERERTTPADVQWTRGLYERTGALAFARGFAEEQLARARAVMNTLPGGGGETLRQLTSFLTQRSH